MSWAQKAWDKWMETKGLRVSVSVPVGVNPFRDLWNLLMGKSDKNHRRKSWKRL